MSNMKKIYEHCGPIETMFVDSELQEIVYKCNKDKLLAAFEERSLLGLSICLDDADCGDVVQKYLDGVAAGSQLVEVYRSEVARRPNVKMLFFTYNLYADDDGWFILIGEREEIKELLLEYVEDG